jgi:hypothetical protein
MAFTATALAFATLTLALAPGTAQAQARATATLPNMFDHCRGTPSVTPPPTSTTSVVAIASFDGPACSQRASGYAYLGVTGASAQVANTVGYLNGQTVAVAEANGGWTDSLSVTWPERFQLVGVDKVRLTFNVSATGSVSSTREPHPFEPTLTAAYGDATISYLFNFAGAGFAGRQHSGAGLADVPVGTWGTIAGSVDLPASANADGTYSFANVAVSLSGEARALVVASTGTASANAEFGSTLQWKGIVGAQAFDAQGQSLVLPAGFALGLVGSQGGFDYWHEAPKVAVPEPAAWALMTAGLALLGWRRGRASSI